VSQTPPNPSNKPPCSREDALAVLMRLRSFGHVAYFAGGCVRDLLLGLEPKDWDIATDAPPARVRELFSQTQAVGQAFGVILVRHGRSTVEVATFRTEGTYSDGRRPDEVAFTNAQEDAQRRDFTINGLFLDPKPTEGSGFRVQGSGEEVQTPKGTVIDYVGGVPDLRDRVLRAIGEPARRFAEDHLRLLRAVRFAARFGLTIEPGTGQAMRANAAKLRGISPERVAEELRMMLSPPTRATAWPMLWEYGLIEVVFRFLPPSEKPAFDPARSLFLRVAPDRPISFALALTAGVLEYRMAGGGNLQALASRQEISKSSRAMREGLRISNEELDAMVGILEPVAVLLAPTDPALAAKKRFLAQPTSPETRLLLRAVAELGIESPRIRQLEADFDDLSKHNVAPTPLLTGDDLVAAGMTPGPPFRKILEAVYDAQLEGRVATREEAMAMAKKMSEDMKT
jgi:poly(A) polymerase